MTNDPLRVGLVGCGMIGQIHADGFRKMSEDGEIVAVGASDPSESAREGVARNCPFGYLTDNPLEVVTDPGVEAVLIASPTSSHRDLVLAAVEAGKSILCEKPLAPNFDIVQELCGAVSASGLVAAVGFHARFHPIVNRLHGTVMSGELGKAMGYVLRDDQYWPTGDVVSGHSSWRSRRSEAGGGALLEHSIHAADILCWLFGPPRRVYARIRSVFGYDVEDVAAVTIEHDSGVVGTLLTIFNGVRGREERRLEVFFENGSVETTTDFIVGASEDRYLVQRPDCPPELPDLEAMRSNHFTRLELQRSDFLFYTYPSDRHWVSCARKGVPASPGFNDALVAHTLVEAAYRSQRTNAEVIPERDLDLAT
ncbi:MAG TPA: Gfo/Idh/MocA family oxidoreductase [Acidimicrobiales bacterium]|nr:Gfo/Idh/MocA family oxidoreductase [Acidimicrobiales bacterium]